MSALISQLYIFDLSDDLIAILDPNDSQAPFFDAYHFEQLNGQNTFNFKIPANNSKANLVVEGNQVAFKDLDGNFQLFEIKIIEELHGDTIIKDIFCEHAVFELLDELILFQWDRDQSASTILGHCLNNTVSGGSRWNSGTVSVSGTATVKMELNNSMESIYKMVKEFGTGDLQYRVTISGTSISNRYVDFLSSRGDNIGKRFEFDKDLKSVKREIDANDVKTALYGFGKAQEFPEGIKRRRFDDIVWSTGAGDARNKPLGQEYLEDTTAKANWGRNGGTRHRWGFYENPDQADPELLLEETNLKLDELITPKISYEMDIIDLERQTGYAHEKVRLGDTVIVIDKTFNPVLQISARVIEITRFLTEPEKDKLILGNFKPLFTTDGATLRDLKDRVHNQQGVWLDSAYKSNMITDHSFENIPRSGSPDADQVYQVLKDTTFGDYGSIFWWQWDGNGYVISSYNDTTLKDYNQLALFDYQAAVISSVTSFESHPYQYVPLNKSVGINGPYTISCYVAAFVQTTVSGNAIINVYACQKDTTRLNSGNPVATGTVYLIHTETDVWKRNIVTITDTLPALTELLEVYITTDTSNFKYLCDGVQLVAMDKTITYEAESNLWKMMRRFPGTKMQYPIFIGNATFTGHVSQTGADTCRAYQSTLQNLSAATWQQILFQTEEYDIRNGYNPANSRFTATSDGYWQVEVCVRLTASAGAGYIGLAIYKNGVILEKLNVAQTLTAFGIQINGSSIVAMSETDYIEIWVYPLNAETTVIGTQETHLKIMKLA